MPSNKRSASLSTLTRLVPTFGRRGASLSLDATSGGVPFTSSPESDHAILLSAPELADGDADSSSSASSYVAGIQPNTLAHTRPALAIETGCRTGDVPELDPSTSQSSPGSSSRSLPPTPPASEAVLTRSPISVPSGVCLQCMGSGSASADRAAKPRPSLQQRTTTGLQRYAQPVKALLKSTPAEVTEQEAQELEAAKKEYEAAREAVQDSFRVIQRVCVDIQRQGGQASAPAFETVAEFAFANGASLSCSTADVALQSAYLDAVAGYNGAVSLAQFRKAELCKFEAKKSEQGTAARRTRAEQDERKEERADRQRVRDTKTPGLCRRTARNVASKATSVVKRRWTAPVASSSSVVTIASSAGQVEEGADRWEEQREVGDEGEVVESSVEADSGALSLGPPPTGTADSFHFWYNQYQECQSSELSAALAGVWQAHDKSACIALARAYWSSMLAIAVFLCDLAVAFAQSLSADLDQPHLNAVLCALATISVRVPCFIAAMSIAVDVNKTYAEHGIAAMGALQDLALRSALGAGLLIAAVPNLLDVFFFFFVLANAHLVLVAIWPWVSAWVVRPMAACMAACVAIVLDYEGGR